ncbi:hypothetical protein [Vallitalea okinawensis]|uniref:hypothetical protein n=1 Tax=Vallitalea okinawensis TaxID=2078660 RepID=UPI000CFB5E06|nr:hypothetical protein [Vallitalea okinawensis]
MFIRIISIKKRLIGILFIPIILLSITVIYLISLNKSPMMMGAFIHMNEESSPENSLTDDDSERSYALGERFERPSKLPALKLKYDLRRLKEDDEVPPYIPEGFPEKYESAEDVVQAYYESLERLPI